MQCFLFVSVIHGWICFYFTGRKAIQTFNFEEDWTDQDDITNFKLYYYYDNLASNVQEKTSRAVTFAGKWGQMNYQMFRLIYVPISNFLCIRTTNR